MIDLDCLASFVDVADAGSFGIAATRRGLSQSGVSQHVSRLEATLGERLIVRGRRASVPSEAGQRLLPYARELLALARRAREAVRSPRLALGASGNIATCLLPELIRRFKDTAEGQGHVVEVSTHDNPELLRRLALRLVDLALTEWAPGDPALTAAAWRREPLGVIVAPQHRLAGRDHVAIEQLVDEPMLGGEPGSGTATLLREAFGAAAGRLTVRQSFGSTEGVKRAVMAGLGVSIVMKRAVRDETRRGELAWLELDGGRLEKTLYVVRRSDEAEDVLSRCFTRFLLAADGGEPGALPSEASQSA